MLILKHQSPEAYYLQICCGCDSVVGEILSTQEIENILGSAWKNRKFVMVSCEP